MSAAGSEPIGICESLGHATVERRTATCLPDADSDTTAVAPDPIWRSLVGVITLKSSSLGTHLSSSMF
jgi:hypothetical protein